MPNSDQLLRPDSVMRGLKAVLFKTLKSKPIPRCLAPGPVACPRTPIRSHSLQRKRTLTPLSEGTGHVVVMDMTQDLDNHLEIRGKPVGISRHASIFHALCAEHDASLFRSIDTEELQHPTEHQLVLLAYRAILREAWEKQRALEHAISITKKIVKDTSTSLELQTLSMIQSYGVQLGMQGIIRVKEAFDRCILNHHVDRALAVRWRHISRPGFAVNGFFTPHFDAVGNRIHAKKGDQTNLPWATVDISFTDSGALVSCSYSRDHRRTAGELVNSVFRRNDDVAFLEGIWELVLRYTENFAIAPSAWERIDSRTQTNICEFFRQTIFNRWISWPHFPAPLPKMPQ